jgi:phosphoglycolate phosphatase
MALVDAVREVAGLETTTDHIPVHGMLDPDILRTMMADAGASKRLIARTMPEIIEAAQRLYLKTCPDLRRKTCPGVRRLLGRLEKRGVVLALVTGNLTQIGLRKLERAGLRQFFEFGAFAEMARDRAGLARLAIGKALRENLLPADRKITLIGDAPSDIIAAKSVGAKSIAVMTGISTREELAAHGPDFLLPDLRALRIEMLV